MMLRTNPVLCMSNNTKMLRINAAFGDAPSFDHVRDLVLQDICKESLSYEQLYALFQKADTEYFTDASLLPNNYALDIDSQNNILLFRLQDAPSFRGKRLFPWDYPETIRHIGYSGTHGREKIMEDISKQSVIRFYMMYRLNAPMPAHCSFMRSGNVYSVDANFQIILDHHITFRYKGAEGHCTEEYIADTWWFSDEDILMDLDTLSLPSFFHKYRAF